MDFERLVLTDILEENQRMIILNFFRVYKIDSDNLMKLNTKLEGYYNVESI